MESTIRLPKGYFVRDGKIYRQWHDKQGDHEELVADGTFSIIAARQYADDPDVLLTVVRFTGNDGSKFQDVQIPVPELTGNGKKLLEYVPDWFILLGPSPAKRLAFLQNALNLQRLEIGNIAKIRRVGPGYHTSDNGILFYCLGSKIINRPMNENLELTSPFHLRDPGEIHGKGVPWARKFCEQGAPQAAQFVATLTAFARPLLEVRNIHQRIAVYVYGESGTGKSETAKLLCSIFQEQTGATLSSDKTDIFRMMAACRDLPFLVDDLNASGIATVSAKKKERLSEIIQQLSGGGTLSIRGETFDVTLATPVITAEKLLKSYSTVNRALIVQYDQPFNPDTMSWLQENHKLYMDFLEGFIGWICGNHVRLKQCVQNWAFPNLNGGIEHPEAYAGFPRLKRTFETLKVTLEIFLLHLREVYAIPQEDEVSWRRLLEEGINQAVFSDTLEHLRKDSPEQERFYVDAVLDIFDDEKQRYRRKEKLVAKSFKKYKDLNKQAKEDARIPKKIFFQDGDYYCFRGDDLVEYLTAQRDNAYKIAKKAVSAQLDFHGLLQRQAGELSYPVAEDGKTRYYHLRVNVVQRMLTERQEEFLAALSDGDRDWIVARR